MLKRILIIIFSAIPAMLYASTDSVSAGQRDRYLGKQLTDLGLYDQALRHHLDALEYFQRNNMIEDVIHSKNDIFRVYYHTRRLKEGEDILLEALGEVADSDTIMRMTILNNLGIVYAATSRPDKALEAYQITLKLAEGNPNARATSLINISDLYLRQDDFATAEQYIRMGLDLPEDSVTNECRTQMLLNLALVCVVRGDNAQAAKVMKMTHGRIERLQPSFAMNTLAQSADIYLNLGDSITALRHILQYELIRDSIQANIDNDQLQSLLIAYDTDRLRARNENLSLALSRRNIIVWSVSTLVIIAIVLIVTILRKHRNEKRANLTIRQQEQQLFQLEKEKAENERRAQQLIIEEKDRQLVSFSIDQAAENKFHSKMEQILKDAIHALPVRGAETTRRHLLDLQSQFRLNRESATGDDFKMYFEQVHPNFFIRLRELHPQLTQIDARLCAFIYLGLSTKEIAAITCKEVRSIETSRLRLRKKLSIDAGADISWYLHSIQLHD
ncbi:MAG: tetratricopeptide repeat protein [Muribaculaceae bacterium]